MASRRDVLRLLIAAPVLWFARHTVPAAQGLGQFTTPSVPCGDVKPTPAAPDGATFKAGAPLKASLVEPGMRGDHLPLTGTVSGVVCGPIKGARVDIWQADAEGRYDETGFRLRGYVLTDDKGVFRIETVLPGAYGGRARHLNARVRADGKPALSTQLFVDGDPMNAKDPAFTPALALKLDRTPAGWAAMFNFVLNA